MDILSPVKSNNSITPYVLKHIIPFAYTLTGSDGFRSLSKHLQSESWEIDCLSEGESELFEHVKRLMLNPDDDQEESICTLLTRKEKDAEIIDRTGNTIASISEYKLFLFQTGIGFLVIDYRIVDAQDTRHFLDSSNLLKSFSAAKTNKLLVKKREKRRLPLTTADFSSNESMAVRLRVENQKETILLLDQKYQDAKYMDKVLILSRNKANDIHPGQTNQYDTYELVYSELRETNLSEYLLHILTGMDITTFFNQFNVTLHDTQRDVPNPMPGTHRKTIMPYKALIFSHLCVLEPHDHSEVEHEYYALANRLSKGYDQNYQIGSLSTDEEERFSYISSPFPNVLWYISREGMSNVVVVKDSNQQKGDGELFLKGDFSHRFNHSYLFLYILGLHQYYGLLQYAMEAAKLPSQVGDYLSANNGKADENLSKLESIREKVTFFYLKCVYTEVSHISHQARIYHRLLKILSIRDMLDEIEKEMVRVSDLASQVRMNEEKKEEARKKKQGDLWTVIGSVYAAIGLYSGMWSIVDRYVMSFLSVQGIERSWLTLFISTGFFLILSLVAVAVIQYRKKELGKDKRH